jgi:hypothetical protein
MTLLPDGAGPIVRASDIAHLAYLETMQSVRAQRFLGLVVAGLLLLATAPAATAATPKAYRIDLGARSDYVAQTNLVQCVGASMQMMLNMTRKGADRSAATQLKLQKLARTWSGPSRTGRQRQGASVRGWAAGLTMMGAGPYKVVGYRTIHEALLTAAKAMRTTGRPVGLLVWRGRHAWVMSGFRSTRDPLLKGAKVTSAIVEDPLYPYGGSTVWGPSPRPGSTLSIGQLGRQFVPRRRSNRFGSLSGMYVLVLPFEFDRRLLRME